MSRNQGRGGFHCPLWKANDEDAEYPYKSLNTPIITRFEAGQKDRCENPDSDLYFFTHQMWKNSSNRDFSSQNKDNRLCIKIGCLICERHIKKIILRFRIRDLNPCKRFAIRSHHCSTSASTFSLPANTTRIFSLDSTITHCKRWRTT